MLYTMYCASPVGRLLLAEKDGALTGLWIEGQKYFLGSVKEEMEEKADSALLRHTKRWIDSYFRGEKPSVREIPLAPSGSKFRKDVWRILCEIPYGEVTTYGEIARKIAGEYGLASMSAQAAGGAVSHNPVSIIIPCHRVIGSDGSLTGYAGGLSNKRKLLALEGADLSRLWSPEQAGRKQNDQDA